MTEDSRGFDYFCGVLASFCDRASNTLAVRRQKVAGKEGQVYHPGMQITPVDRFGKHHWSLLAFIQTLCRSRVDGVGSIERRHVRTNEHRHPLLAANAHLTPWKPEYSTRLAGFFAFEDRNDLEKSVAAGFQLLDHDDWDVLDDLNAAGLVETLSLTNGSVRMTPAGVEVADLIGAHKTKGGAFADFRVPDYLGISTAHRDGQEIGSTAA